MKRNERGITLISLVVTIIVLILLAGVTINLILDDNGIIKKAQTAKTKSVVARAKEQMQLDIATKQMDNMLKGKGNVITKSELEEILTDIGTINENEDGTVKSVTIKDTDEEILITEIVEGIEVVPDQLKKDANGVEEGKSGYLGGNYDDPYIPVGFEHFGNADWNRGYQIKDGEENIFVWVPCVLTQTEESTADGVQTFTRTTTGKYNSNNLTLSTTNSIVTDVNPTNAVKTSVGTYGGFYIAAYEAGVPVVAGSQMNPVNCAQYINTQYKARSMPNAVVWTWLSRNDAVTAAANMIDATSTGVNSGLITGECWDTTLQWITNTTDSAYAENSEEKGYYTSTNESIYRTTSNNAAYGKNNIYDMAGNVMETTAESCLDNITASYQVLRGGNASNMYAAYRYNPGGIYGNATYGFRVVLYK